MTMTMTMTKFVIGVSPRPNGRLTGYLTVLMDGTLTQADAIARATRAVAKEREAYVRAACTKMLAAGDFAMQVLEV